MKKEDKQNLKWMGFSLLISPLLAVGFILLAGFIPLCMYIVSRVGTAFTNAVYPHL